MLQGQRRLASGPAGEVALVVKRVAQRPDEPIIIFEDSTGRSIDFDLRGTRSDTLHHLWPEVTGPVIPANEELRRVAAAYAEARDQEKVAKEDKEGFGVQIAAMLGDNAGATWGRSRVTRVDRAQRIDWQAYALSLGGTEAGAEKFRPPPQRTLDVRIKEK